MDKAQAGDGQSLARWLGDAPARSTISRYQSLFNQATFEPFEEHNGRDKQESIDYSSSI